MYRIYRNDGGQLSAIVHPSYEYQEPEGAQFMAEDLFSSRDFLREPFALLPEQLVVIDEKTKRIVYVTE